MPEYRAYILSDDGHIQSYEPIVCDNDDRAIAAANGHDVELWEGKRKVTTLVRRLSDPATI